MGHGPVGHILLESLGFSNGRRRQPKPDNDQLVAAIDCYLPKKSCETERFGGGERFWGKVVKPKDFGGKGCFFQYGTFRW